MKYRYRLNRHQVPTLLEWIFRVWLHYDYYAYEASRGFNLLGFKFSTEPKQITYAMLKGEVK